MSNTTIKPALLRGIALTMPLLITACTGISTYKKPDTNLPAAWSAAAPEGPRQDRLATWWQVFEDPRLNALMAQAKRGNLDLKEAFSRLEESRLQLGLRRGEKMPVIGAEASGLRQGTSEGQFFPGATFDNYQVTVPISWEIDLFGRIKHRIAAAQRDYEAEREDYAGVLIQLFANVAASHFEILQASQRMMLLQDNITAIEKTTALTRSRAKHGLATGLEVAQAEQLLASTQAALPPLQATLHRLRHRQAVLLGKTPQDHPVPSFKNSSQILPRFADDIAGSPADLLRQRPDIRAAERQLAAQHARANVARAERFPSLSLTALLGRDALRLGDLFDAGSGIWNLGASLSQTLFNGGRLRGQIKLQDAKVNTALVAYERTVLHSLEEVENALVHYHGLIAEGDTLKKALKAANTSVTQAERLYKEGLTDFENVLDSRRQQLTVQDQLAIIQGNTALGLVQIYLALGGGWDPNAPGTAIDTTTAP